MRARVASCKTLGSLCCWRTLRVPPRDRETRPTRRPVTAQPRRPPSPRRRRDRTARTRAPPLRRRRRGEPIATMMNGQSRRPWADSPLPEGSFDARERLWSENTRLRLFGEALIDSPKLPEGSFGRSRTRSTRATTAPPNKRSSGPRTRASTTRVCGRAVEPTKT